MVIDELEIAEVTRVGYREQYYFSFDDKEDSEKWIADLDRGLAAYNRVRG